MLRGKFHGVMAPTTPTGSCLVYTKKGPSVKKRTLLLRGSILELSLCVIVSVPVYMPTEGSLSLLQSVIFCELSLIGNCDSDSDRYMSCCMCYTHLLCIYWLFNVCIRPVLDPSSVAGTFPLCPGLDEMQVYARSPPSISLHMGLMAYHDFCSIKELGSFKSTPLSLLDGMLVHCRVIPLPALNSPVPIYTSIWVEIASVTVKCPAQEHNTVTAAD